MLKQSLKQTEYSRKQIGGYILEITPPGLQHAQHSSLALQRLSHTLLLMNARRTIASGVSNSVRVTKMWRRR
jgi:hypothetical protein